MQLENKLEFLMAKKWENQKEQMWVMMSDQYSEGWLVNV